MMNTNIKQRQLLYSANTNSMCTQEEVATQGSSQKQALSTKQITQHASSAKMSTNKYPCVLSTQEPHTASSVGCSF